MSTSTPALQASILSQIPTSPQIFQTLRNLQKITQINVDSPHFKSSIKHFSEQHMVLYKSHTTQQGITQYVCFLQDQRDGEMYLNQLTGQVFRVQPLEGLVLERKPSDMARLDQPSLNNLKLIYEKLGAYMDKYFSGSYAVTCHFKIDSATVTQIIIGFTNKYTSPTNFSSAEWTSSWSFKSTNYSAKITSRNHFHQGGNIIFQRPKSIHKVLPAQKAIPVTNLTEQAIDYMVAVIQDEERFYQKQLEKIYSQKLSQSVKKLRRISPLTQGKMIWNVNAVLLSQGLNEKLPNMV